MCKHHSCLHEHFVALPAQNQTTGVTSGCTVTPQNMCCPPQLAHSVLLRPDIMFNGGQKSEFEMEHSHLGETMEHSQSGESGITSQSGEMVDTSQLGEESV
jgi:hypothetical protein